MHAKASRRGLKAVEKEWRDWSRAEFEWQSHACWICASEFSQCKLLRHQELTHNVFHSFGCSLPGSSSRRLHCTPYTNGRPMESRLLRSCRSFKGHHWKAGFGSSGRVRESQAGEGNACRLCLFAHPLTLNPCSLQLPPHSRKTSAWTVWTPSKS